MHSQNGKPRRRIVVRRSSIHGKGVFATTFIPADTRLIEYKGERRGAKSVDLEYGGQTHTFLFLLENEKEVIDANRGGNAARWINHSCTPNCEPNEKNGRIFIDTIRDIYPGEELSFDYKLYLEERYTPSLKRLYACMCGTEQCRGTMLAR